MSRRVLIIDTSVLCCLLKVPGKDTAGPKGDLWDHARIAAIVAREEKAGSTFVLPLATIIETGNHIAQAVRNRFEIAGSLATFIANAANATSPWAAFTDQAHLWGATQLNTLAASWPALAAGGTSIGDATIKDVAEWYAQAGYAVEIATADAGLKAYQPAQPPLQPRRRSS